jgi:hypothetical protein
VAFLWHIIDVVSLAKKFKVFPMKIFLILMALGISSYFIFLPKSEDKKLNLNTPSKEFNKHWYDGKAEIASYTLKQNRYGDSHEGYAVLVYVTEDFSKSKQVKLDNPEKAGGDKAPILKLNFSKSFLTGIYPYTILNSIFTPVDLSGTIKSSCSVQEWCGHTYMQLNKNKKGFQSSQYSYFETEGDSKQQLPNALLEDEIWNIIRINPEKIPQGKVSIIRGNIAVRLIHKPLEIVSATITTTNATMNGKSLKALEIKYADRDLKVYYESTFPNTILGWDETYGEFGNKPSTTVARLLKKMRLPYWQLHNNEHRIYRDSLGLPKN